MKRPLSIAILACTYIVMGAVGFAYHFPELRIQQTIQYDAVGVKIIRLSAFRTLSQLVVLIVFCAVIGALPSGGDSLFSRVQKFRPR